MPSVPRLWPGETVICIASGPSLTQEDVASVRGNARVIAVNDGIRWSKEFADVLYSSDRNFWPHYKGMPDFHGLKFGLGSNVGMRNPFPGLPDIQVLRYTGVEGLELEPDGLRCGRNSGAAAIGLAMHLGAVRVLLLGYDCGRGSSGQAHFFGDHPVGLNTTSQAMFDKFRRMFDTLVEPLSEAGVEVINCSRETALTAFPRMPLEDALATRNCRAA